MVFAASDLLRRSSSSDGGRAYCFFHLFGLWKALPHSLTKDLLWTAGGDYLFCQTEERVSHGGVAELRGEKDPFLSPFSIRACCQNKDLHRGLRIHAELDQRSLLDRDHTDALIALYAKCGDLRKARAVLDRHSSSNVIPWTALIAGYARDGKAREALDCYEMMQRKGVLPNEVTFVCMLKACATSKALDVGKKIHDEILRQGLLERHIALGGALVDMYAKCGALWKARSVLDKLPHRNVVSWSALMTGYIQNGQCRQALDCFEQMQREGVLPNEVAYACSLKACATVGAIEKGKNVHDEISRQGLLEHDIVLGGALVDMYAKCGALHQAQTVLEKLPSRNIASWGALIAGYSHNAQGEQALECFERMRQESIFPDEGIFCCLLNLCRHLGSVRNGEELFDSMEAIHGLKPDVATLNCMVDLLGRTGHLVKAVEVIQGMPSSASIAIWHGLLGTCMKWTDANVATTALDRAVDVGNCNAAAYVFTVKYMQQLICQRRLTALKT